MKKVFDKKPKKRLKVDGETLDQLVTAGENGHRALERKVASKIASDIVSGRWDYKWNLKRILKDADGDDPESVLVASEKMIDALRKEVRKLKDDDMIDDLEDVIDEFEVAGEDVEQFDFAMERLYDFADSWRVWIN